METNYRRMDYPLDDNLYCSITASHWIFDLCHYRRICLWGWRGVAHSGISYSCGLGILLLGIADNLTKIRRTSRCQRQALCSSHVDIEARWSETTGDDPPLSITILPFEWSYVHVSICPSGNVCSRNGDNYTKAPSSCLHWQSTCSDSKEWGNDECGYSCNQLHQHCCRSHCRGHHWLVHLPEDNGASTTARGRGGQ